MSEADALDHCVKWIEAVAEQSDEISINPMTSNEDCHRSTPSPSRISPSMALVLGRTHSTESHIVHPNGGMNGDNDHFSFDYHPTAGGKIRGSHNCGECDAEVVAAIERYAVSGSLDEFQGLDCVCKNQWNQELTNDRTIPVPLGTSMPRRGSLTNILRSP